MSDPLLRFNSNVSFLLKIVKKLHKNDPSIERIFRGVATVRKVDETALAKAIGPYLLKFKDQITAYDDSMLAVFDISSESNEPVVAEIFDKIRESYHGMSPKEKLVIKDKVNAMLTSYIECKIKYNI